MLGFIIQHYTCILKIVVNGECVLIILNKLLDKVAWKHVCWFCQHLFHHGHKQMATFTTSTLQET